MKETSEVSEISEVTNEIIQAMRRGGNVDMMQRLEREKRTVSAMIRLYCSQKHNSDGDYALLCRQCTEIEMYAHYQVDHCRYGNRKPSCGQCTTPCYTPEKRKAIKQVMRTTRRKMLFYHPVLTCFHVRDYVRFRKKK